MSVPFIKNYTRNFFMDRIKNKELQVGDTVYYLAPSASYSIKKSVITEKRENQSKGRFHLFKGCELTLADGTTIEYDKVFDSKEQVLAYIVDDLQTSVASKRIGLQTLQKELAVCERLLKMYKDALQKNSVR